MYIGVDRAMKLQPERDFTYTTSRFWSRLESHPAKSGDIDALKSLVSQVVAQADTISGWIIKHLDQFTLHNETHFRNVLRLMDALVLDQTIGTTARILVGSANG
jgi:hypothetical protein